MKKIIKVLKKEEIELLGSLIGKKLNYIHRQNEQFFDMTLERVGIDVEGSLYKLDADYEYDDFLWENESYAKLSFKKVSSKDDFIIKAEPPLRYIDDKIDDTILDVLLVEDSIIMTENGMDSAFFKHAKGIVFCFDSYQIALYLVDCLIDDFITVTKSPDAVSKINSTKDEWDNGCWSTGLGCRSYRNVVSVKKLL